MTINKYTGETKEAAIAAAKAELGDSIVIMNTKNRKPDGLLGIIKPSIWEVTVAIEEETDGSVSILKNDAFPTSTFQAAADEDIKIPPVGAVEAIAENDLKSAFREISQVIKDAEEKNTLHDNGRAKAPSAGSKNEEPHAKETSVNEKKPSGDSDVQGKTVRADKNLPIVRMVYNNLMDNEVDEKFINQIFDDIGNIFSSANSLDLMISNIYQKMVLKLGSPSPITLSEKGPKVVFFVGPTGVGKTTTIAKIASDFKVTKKKKVSFITADTYRIAATEQLNVYANILDAPISIVYEPSELKDAVEAYRDQDLILVDTVGFSHRNEEQKLSTRDLIDALPEKYEKQVYLVMSITTKYADLKDISDTYRDICDYNLIFTKLDETEKYGNILNLKMYTDASLSYVTIGQNVPDDIELIKPQALVRTMLGG